MIDFLKNYQRLFKVQGLKFLIDDIWTNYYQELSVLVVYLNDEFTSFLPEDVIKKTMREGSVLYGDVSEFKKYHEGFREHEKKTLDFCVSLLKFDKLDKEQVQNFFELYSIFFSYYSKTEFFYTDGAYQATQDKENLNRILDDLKNSTRTTLNQMFFGNGSYLSQFLKKISQQFNVVEGELQHYSIADVLALFEGVRLEQEIITARSTAFYVVGNVVTKDVVVGEEARSEINKFLSKFENVSSSNKAIKGVIANSGLVSGVARVIVSGYDNFDQMSVLMSEMKDGEILVSETTSPELMIACKKAAAIITDQGGLLSHAAIISRELRVPCIVGTKNATKLIKSGDRVLVDANNGIISVI